MTRITIFDMFQWPCLTVHIPLPDSVRIVYQLPAAIGERLQALIWSGQITRACCTRYLTGLDGTKSTGYDKIPASLIKTAAEELSLPTMNLVNQTIRNTKFPNEMKLSEISPIFKTSDTLETGNYRPINILPCLSKIFERLYHEQLYEFFSSILSAFLAAFRRNYGCHHVLTKFVHDCKVAIDKGLNVGVVLMDLSKAFDCVPHGLLLTKLKYYGLTDQACLLLKSYISDRKQRVKIGISRSAWGPVDHGVPQGSILGPLIFNIFINDLFYAMDDVCSVYNYADDNTLLNTDHRIDSLVVKLENSAMVATHWFDINGMKSNQSKFQAMILNKHPDQNNISLNVNGTNVPLKSCVKLLGVFIDYELTFSEHVNYICKRTSRQLNAIRRISKYLKRDCLMKLFHAFVSSNLNYCPTTWHFTSKSSTMKIEKVHKAALRVVYNDYTTSYSRLLDKSNRTPLFLARLKGLLVEVFKCIRGLNPDFMNTIFVMDNKPYDTRSGSTISQNRVKTIKYGIQSFAYQGAKCWNLLPANIKEIEDLNEFRRHVSQWNGPVCHCGCCVACTIKEL